MTYIKNVNCKHYTEYGFCRHPDRSRFLGIFRRNCVEKGISTCSILEQRVFHNPGVPTKAPPRREPRVKPPYKWTQQCCRCGTDIPNPDGPWQTLVEKTCDDCVRVGHWPRFWTSLDREATRLHNEQCRKEVSDD